MEKQLGVSLNRRMPAKSLTALLAGIVDYAGLFPPAALSMTDAVRNYAAYLSEQDSWMLGRFIVPTARLSEFEHEVQPLLFHSSLWKLSVLAGENVRDDVNMISDFNSRYVNKAIIDTVELNAVSVGDIQDAASIVPRSFQRFIEIPINHDPTKLIQAIAEAGAKAKVRTGGVTSDAFLSSHDLALFIYACVKMNVQFKATAGLHHPIRSVYNLTYKPNSERGKMYGYLNVFLAAAFVKEGMGFEEAVNVLEEESHDAFKFDDTEVSWRSYRLDMNALKNVRKNLAISFGSCSFREPIDDLKAMNIY